MKRYEMLGRLNSPLDIQDHAVGDVFEADLDPSIEEVLCSRGALRVLADAKPKAEPTTPTRPQADGAKIAADAPAAGSEK